MGCTCLNKQNNRITSNNVCDKNIKYRGCETVKYGFFFLSVVKKKRSIFNLKSAESQKPKIKNLFLFFLFFVHRSSSHRFISLLILFLRFPFLFLFLFFFFAQGELRTASVRPLTAAIREEKSREEQRNKEQTEHTQSTFPSSLIC